MKTQDYQTEKAIIDALLKISEIVQKTEVNRNKLSKKTIGDGDYKEFYNNNQQVPMPPPMRTFDSYVTGFNQQSVQNPSNCNQASVHREKKYSSENNKQSKKYSYKRCYYDSVSTSSSSNDHHRKKSSFQTNKNSLPTSQEMEKSENQPPIPTFNSTSTTICDHQPSSLTPSNVISNSKTDFDQQLQTTLEKCLKNHLLSSIKTSNENLQYQRKLRLSNLTKAETENLIEQLDFTKQICNLDHYEKQRELAMLAVKQGNYSLSYSIYTTLLHDHQYDYKLKSEILSSRATILLLDQKCFESIDDCTQAIALNQWNKLAYVIRAACWMLKQEYLKAVDDYSKLFHYFDQSQHVLDLLNFAYEKFQLSNNNQQLIEK